MKDPLMALDINSVKKQFEGTFLELRAIINKHDPLGLIGIGAPLDEYEPEVKTIIVQFKNRQSLNEIHDLVYNEFLRWFEDESTIGPKEAYKNLVMDIYNWRNEKK